MPEVLKVSLDLLVHRVEQGQQAVKDLKDLQVCEMKVNREQEH